MTETLPTIDMQPGDPELKVGENTVVTVRYLHGDKERDETLRLVDRYHGARELWRGSPLGEALKGKGKGEEVLVQLPSGATVLVKILEVDSA